MTFASHDDHSNTTTANHPGLTLSSLPFFHVAAVQEAQEIF